ncbi:MAG: hypothetical protein IPG78_04925 [Ignavibacteria bacterium]|nr:hypothetical protein [Ignavibacteria bacterium]
MANKTKSKIKDPKSENQLIPPKFPAWEGVKAVAKTKSKIKDQKSENQLIPNLHIIIPLPKRGLGRSIFNGQ